AGQLAAVAEADTHAGVVADDVGVGQQEAVGGEQDARARALAPATAHAEVDDGGPQRVGHADHHARISVQRVEFVARRVGRGRVVDGAGTVVDEVFPESRHG